MSYICRDCKFNITGALPNPPRCPECSSIYLLQDKNKLRKLKEDIRRIAHLRKNKEDPLTIYDRIFSSFFIVLVTAATLFVGPVLSMFLGGRGGSVEILMWEYRFILDWWPSILFSSAIMGFVFGVDKVLDFFGLIWGAVKENEEVKVVVVFFVIAVVMYVLIFQ